MLTGEASNAYKAFLREKNIPYIIAGENTIDAKLALEKLKILFHMVFVMLGGGVISNWSFIQDGLCYEVNFVIAPVADSAANTPLYLRLKKECQMIYLIHLLLKMLKPMKKVPFG